jgi:uncharacterized repeat protein (TIGR03803 family)
VSLRSRGQIAIMFAVTVLAFASPASAGAWTETLLYRFAGESDGSAPYGDVIRDRDGNLFGTTAAGGAACTKKDGCGTVFKLAPDGTETVLYAFQGGDDGGEPRAGLVADQGGNLYGTTTIPKGTVFKVTPEGVHTVLHIFESGDGADPLAGLITDNAGNLYGTAAVGGGRCGCGTVFRITTAGAFTVLYAFQGGADGRDPQGPLVADSTGNLYGTTTSGGDVACDGYQGCGTIFKLTPDGHETVLYAFHGGQDGRAPFGDLALDSVGNIYGATAIGGGNHCFGDGCGTVFELTPDGSESVLASFEYPGAPTFLHGGVVLDKKGILYGTGLGGGTEGCGGVFKLAPGKAAKTIHSFACVGDGRDPIAGLLRGGRGRLVGTTLGGGNRHGTVFALQQQ